MNRRKFIKTSGIFLAVVSSNSSLFASDIDFRAVENPTLLTNGPAKMFCSVCGMHLGQFYKTNHAAEINNKTHQYCSFHCMVEESENLKPENPKVVDTNTLKFIDASLAYYVYGSNKPATMSTVSSYGFNSKDAAENFAKDFGGEVLTYETLLEKTKADIADDLKLIEKRQSMAAKKGEKIYIERCAKIDKKFKTSGEAKAYLLENKPCGELNMHELSQLSHYLKMR
ncbi:nitrous oxide reductase accessory protein NosL [Campylobacter corcagiensis]|uniref:Nitrous oxide reductase accessory protein NosL n=1 Tax=Campylobacter corcagiensis TaxID=1448857 RepID=A0A7M1LJG7_9BACT|nr:nitrous oxide reductase accessory protein NosL [Campylobacter corcagiensis]QKF64140.1 NosL domain-containing protein [Campylobacter corcagiensis]QOQ87665.1 nitrous oxide reductase accessory protein NosL [Campylobacter corcagiensis]